MSTHHITFFGILVSMISIPTLPVGPQKERINIEEEMALITSLQNARTHHKKNAAQCGLTVAGACSSMSCSLVNPYTAVGAALCCASGLSSCLLSSWWQHEKEVKKTQGKLTTLLHSDMARTLAWYDQIPLKTASEKWPGDTTQLGQTLDKLQKRLRSPLWHAVREDNAHQVEELCKNRTNSEDLTELLFGAVRAGSINVIPVLVKHGASINAQDPEDCNKTPLYCAVENNDLAAVQALVTAGTCKKQNSGLTSLRLAVRMNKQADIISLLLPMVDSKELGEQFTRAVEGGSVPCVKAFLEKICDKQKTAQWALAHASEAENRSLMELLVNTYNADVNKPNEKGYSLLHRAAFKGKREEALILLDMGAKIHALTRYDSTPLHHASEEGHVQTVQLLLARGADPRLEDEWGNTALDLAIFAQRTAVQPLLQHKLARLKEKSRIKTSVQSSPETDDDFALVEKQKEE